MLYDKSYKYEHIREGLDTMQIQCLYVKYSSMHTDTLIFMMTSFF